MIGTIQRCRMDGFRNDIPKYSLNAEWFAFPHITVKVFLVLIEPWQPLGNNSNYHTECEDLISVNYQNGILLQPRDIQS